MGMVSAGSMVGFEGKLVQKQDVGQKYIQLVFSTTEGVRLSVSRNLRMAHSLTIGRTYRVKGTECLLGKKTYIREPVAIPIQDKKSFALSRRKIITIAAVMIIAAGATTFAAVSHRSSPAQTHAVKTASKDTAKPVTTAPAAAVAAQPSAVTPAASTPAPTTKKTSAKPAAQPVATKPAAASPAAQPTNSTAAETPAATQPSSPSTAQPAAETTTPPTTTDPPAETPSTDPPSPTDG
jgi:hypothetical protein